MRIWGGLNPLPILFYRNCKPCIRYRPGEIGGPCWIDHNSLWAVVTPAGRLPASKLAFEASFTNQRPIG
jgi:hypothetical protein